MNRLVIAAGPRDPRLYDVDDDFRRALVDLSGLMVASASRRARFFHATSVSAGGELHVLDAPELPAHAFFRPGRDFRVIARYSNSQGTDDVSPTVRGLTLRLLDPDGTARLDLTFNTGPCFFAATAETFRRAFASERERAEVLTEIPAMRSVIWSNIRTATAYPAYDFHSQVPQGFVAEDGTQWLVRYRLRPTGEPVRRGEFDHGDAWWPPDAPDEIDRPAGDARPGTVLRDDLRARLADGGVTGVLQAQLHPVTGSAESGPPASGLTSTEVPVRGTSPGASARRREDAGSRPANAERQRGNPTLEVERAMDASVPWPRAWFDLARLRLTEPLDDTEVDPTAFDPALAPPELGIVLNRSPHSTGSLNHLRALLYQMAAAGRSGRPLPDRLGALLRPVERARAEPGRRTVCVLGAGATGLTVARELERAGHHAIVVEAAADVGGKCASVTLDGRAYDLGGHICTSRYHRLAALAEELGVATEPTTPYRVLDPAPRPQDMSFFRDGAFARYQRLRARLFPRIGEPGLAHSAHALADPVGRWLAEHDLASMAATFGPGYTAAGYGHLDGDVPALYFVKYAELTGLLSADEVPLGHLGAFTVAGGFATLWRAVAAGLRDVRTEVEVLAIERDGDGVRVHTTDGLVTADDLVVTVPLDQLRSVMDLTGPERELAAMVRYHDYRTTVITVDGLPGPAFHLLPGQPAGEGHCVAFHHRYADRPVQTCYSYAGADRVAEDLAALGGRPGPVHLIRDWRFMPHFGPEDLRAGALDRLERLQGVRHTYHAGSLPAFELVECAVGYAEELVREHFPDSTSSEADVRRWLVANIAAELALTEDQVDPDAPLEQYAMESLQVAALQAGLSDHLGFRVPHTLFLQVPTINAAARFLVRDTAGTTPPGPTPHLVPLTPARPFFCVGGVGGPATYLRPLAAALGDERPFVAVELPVSGDPPDTVEDIAAILLPEIREAQPSGPYRLGGHSLGGLVAYELGCRLRAEGQPVAPVVVLDTYLAVAGAPEPVADERGALTELLAVRHLRCAGRCTCGVDPTRPLADQRDAVLAALGVGDEGQLASVLAAYEAGLRALAAYVPPPSDLAVHLMVTDRGFAPLGPADHRVRMHLDAPANGWEHVALGALTVTGVGGGHFSMFVQPHVSEVAAAVRAPVKLAEVVG